MGHGFYCVVGSGWQKCCPDPSFFRIYPKRVQYRGYNVMWKMIVGSRVQLGDEKGM